MLRKTVVALCLAVSFAAGTVSAQQIVEINKIRGEYEINFETVFQVPIFPDIETMISMPPGYKITLAMPGSPDYVSANVLQNTLYLTRPVDHSVETNVAVHVITPDGLEEKLVLRCIGPKKSSNKVLAVQFTKPNSSELNRTVEAMKARYLEQLHAKMSAQEKDLSDIVFQKTMSYARSWFIHSNRKKISKEYKGAEVYVDGVINGEESTFIYMISSVKGGECDIIDLERVSIDKRKLTPQLIGYRELSKDEYYYCWSVPKVRIDGKSKKLRLFTKIWSKVHEITVKIS